MIKVNPDRPRIVKVDGEPVYTAHWHIEQMFAENDRIRMTRTLATAALVTSIICAGIVILGVTVMVAVLT